MTHPMDNAAPSAWLVVLAGGHFGAETPLTEARVLVIGRDASLAGLVLTDLRVAPCHAHIAFEGGRYVIHDLGALYGAYVNNSRIIEQPLRHNDLIQLGDTRLVFFTTILPPGGEGNR